MTSKQKPPLHQTYKDLFIKNISSTTQFINQHIFQTLGLLSAVLGQNPSLEDKNELEFIMNIAKAYDLHSAIPDTKSAKRMQAFLTGRGYDLVRSPTHYHLPYALNLLTTLKKDPSFCLLLFSYGVVQAIQHLSSTLCIDRFATLLTCACEADLPQKYRNDLLKELTRLHS